MGLTSAYSMIRCSSVVERSSLVLPRLERSFRDLVPRRRFRLGYPVRLPPFLAVQERDLHRVLRPVGGSWFRWLHIDQWVLRVRGWTTPIATSPPRDDELRQGLLLAASPMRPFGTSPHSDLKALRFRRLRTGWAFLVGGSWSRRTTCTALLARGRAYEETSSTRGLHG